ncbi:hypothetical protein GOBAR_AA15659 [Gossypium barbadense]|uniref:SWIM-type domain-containing protein n=1 Tax=Gossypium barbadense TaxID=3634 RepID=A0A2P5XNR9_GOSBA|nr:hypothetical protein GOBAR_AA15659 [Gossypium barbadense]
MELVDDEYVETMLFAELAGIEATEDPISLGEEDGAQEPCMVVPISYVDSQSTIHGTDIDLNAAPETDVVGDDVYHSSDPSDHELDSESDPDIDEVPDDINDEGVNNDGNVNASLARNHIRRRIVIHNNFGVHMSWIDPDAAHAAEFSEYPEILSAHRMAVYSDLEELFMGQRFEKCWRSAEGCNWWIRAAFIQKSQMWEIRKFVGPHTCTSIRMTEDHRKLDSKTICTCIMLMVKDMPTIKVLVLIAEMQARFQYRVSYRKAWIAKQMAMEQLYGDFDASYNELQGWIAATRENVLPIAFAIVDKENIELWEFFLTNLQRRSNVPWRSFYYIRHIAANFQRDYKNTDWKRQVVRLEYVRDAIDANCRMARSMTVEVYSRCNETFRFTKTIGRRPGIPPRSYGVDLQNRRCDCRRFQTLHYPCAHVVAACAKVSLNVEQFIDEVYTFEHTLRV